MGMINSYDDLVKISDKLNPEAIKEALIRVEERINDILSTQKGQEAKGDSCTRLNLGILAFLATLTTILISNKLFFVFILTGSCLAIIAFLVSLVFAILLSFPRLFAYKGNSSEYYLSEDYLTDESNGVNLYKSNLLLKYKERIEISKQSLDKSVSLLESTLISQNIGICVFLLMFTVEFIYQLFTKIQISIVFLA
jgi:hypothetical protein